jgi:hypothetical protein
MNEEERLAAERVSCAAAGCLLLIAGGALVWGACLRWPWLPKAAGMLAAWGAAAAVVWALALRLRSGQANEGAMTRVKESACKHATQD